MGQGPAAEPGEARLLADAREQYVAWLVETFGDGLLEGRRSGSTAPTAPRSRWPRRCSPPWTSRSR